MTTLTHPHKPTLFVSARSIDLIISSEVSSEANYNKKLRNPIFPGLNSGITWGIGYDAGYNSEEQITADWQPHVNATTLKLMLSVAGMKGATAKKRLASVKAIVIPFHIARTVFIEKMLPKYAADACRAYPGLEHLLADAAGAILSLVFNRGTSFKGATRTEMAALKPVIIAKNYAGIASLITAMKRLWDGISPDGEEKRVEGLLTRRDAEAKLSKSPRATYSDSEIVGIALAA